MTLANVGLKLLAIGSRRVLKLLRKFEVNGHQRQMYYRAKNNTLIDTTRVFLVITSNYIYAYLDNCIYVYLDNYIYAYLGNYIYAYLGDRLILIIETRCFKCVRGYFQNPSSRITDEEV